MLYDSRLPDRFWNKINVVGECWEWIAALDRWGYGRYGIGNKTYLSHRIAYLTLVAHTDLSLDHLCRNRKCCNPAHLEPVSLLENLARGSQGINKTHCNRGHELTPDNVYTPPNGRWRKVCKICRRKSNNSPKALERVKLWKQSRKNKG